MYVFHNWPYKQNICFTQAEILPHLSAWRTGQNSKSAKRNPAIWKFICNLFINQINVLILINGLDKMIFLLEKPDFSAVHFFYPVQK
ncbi:MAG: hypothetical protein DRI57_14940 [Deltaproteobacteria bacterium]|nr:MAG: hypothetical protein DRI57_14940 [Deltaproteobacteria bacterium]